MVLDEKQRQIIRELQKDAKQSLRDLGETLNLPVSTVYSRIQKMENEKIIDSYKTIFNAEKVGLPSTAFILIRLRFSDLVNKIPYDFREIAEKLALLDEVQEVHLITGEWDMMVKVKGPSTKDIGQFVVDNLRTVEGVDRCTTFVVFDSIKETTDLPI